MIEMVCLAENIGTKNKTGEKAKKNAFIHMAVIYPVIFRAGLASKTGNDYNKQKIKNPGLVNMKTQRPICFFQRKIKYSLKQKAPLIHHFTKTFS